MMLCTNLLIRLRDELSASRDRMISTAALYLVSLRVRCAASRPLRGARGSRAAGARWGWGFLPNAPERYSWSVRPREQSRDLASPLPWFGAVRQSTCCASGSVPRGCSKSH